MLDEHTNMEATQGSQIENLGKTYLSLPDDPPDTATKTETRIWEKEVDEYVQKKLYIDENLKNLYSLIWGQCTDVIRARIEALDEHEDISNQGDSIKLLKAIKSLVFNFESQKYRPLAIHDGMRQFYNIYQDKHATCQSYLEKFQNCVDVLDHCLWWIHWVYTRTGERNSRRKQFLMATKEQMADAMKASQDKYLAVAFLLGSDQNRYRKLIKNLENDYTQGQNCCPKTLTTAYSLLTNWKQDAHNKPAIPWTSKGWHVIHQYRWE
jgi:hypothetical protein